MFSQKKGFTLIEMMVAVSVFTIVALVISGALVTLMGIYKYIQVNRVVVDNLSFTMDTMTLQIREGKNHILYDNPVCDFAPGCYHGIEFTEYIIRNNNYEPFRKISYKFDENNNSIIQCTGEPNQSPPTNCFSLTSSEIMVDNFLVFVLDVDSTEKKIFILLTSGYFYDFAGSNNSFSLQTALFQRNI